MKAKVIPPNINVPNSIGSVPCRLSTLKVWNQLLATLKRKSGARSDATLQIMYSASTTAVLACANAFAYNIYITPYLCLCLPIINIIIIGHKNIRAKGRTPVTLSVLVISKIPRIIAIPAHICHMVRYFFM